MAKASPAAKAAPNPFETAQRKPTVSTKAADANIIVAQDYTAYDGAFRTEAETIEAIDNYVEGATLFNQGRTMKDTNRPVILSLARTMYARDWLMRGARPSNPKVAATADGRGSQIGVLFFDSVNKLDANSYGALANLIGAKAAEEVTLKRDDFIINPEVLGNEATVKVDGKIQKMNVMDAIAKALQDAFSPSPEMLRSLFQVIPKFETTKGLINKGPALVTTGKTPADAVRLAQFLEIGDFTTQLRPGASGKAVADAE